jgi:hypothetical protein
LIDFRYHVVSIIAVFLALALGLFVGSTSLQDAVVHTINSKADRVTRDNNALSAQVHNLQGIVSANGKFTKALLPYAVSGRLSGQQVSVISAPEASDAVRKQVIAAISAAGATLSADVRLQNAIVDPKQDAFLTALTERVEVPGHPNAPNADGWKRAAAQLAAVLAVRPNSRAVAPASVETVLSAYATGKLLRLGNATTSPRPGDLAVVLTGPPPQPTADPVAVKAETDFLVELLSDLDQAALGAVLAVPTQHPGTAADGTVVAANTLGVTDQASTVIGIDSPPGQIAMVFALVAQVDGISGRFDPTSAAASPFPSARGAP